MSSDVLESCLNTARFHCGHVEYHQYRFRPGFAHTNWRTLRKRSPETGHICPQAKPSQDIHIVLRFAIAVRCSQPLPEAAGAWLTKSSAFRQNEQYP